MFNLKVWMEGLLVGTKTKRDTLYLKRFPYLLYGVSLLYAFLKMSYFTLNIFYRERGLFDIKKIEESFLRPLFSRYNQIEVNQIIFLHFFTLMWWFLVFGPFNFYRLFQMSASLLYFAIFWSHFPMCQNAERYAKSYQPIVASTKSC